MIFDENIAGNKSPRRGVSSGSYGRGHQLEEAKKVCWGTNGRPDIPGVMFIELDGHWADEPREDGEEVLAIVDLSSAPIPNSGKKRISQRLKRIKAWFKKASHSPRVWIHQGNKSLFSKLRNPFIREVHLRFEKEVCFTRAEFNYLLEWALNFESAKGELTVHRNGKGKLIYSMRTGSLQFTPSIGQ